MEIAKIEPACGASRLGAGLAVEVNMKLSSKTKENLWVCVWLLVGTYFAIAAIGGSHTAAAMTLLCGYIAGRAP